RRLDQPAQIGEIADAPVALGAQCIELCRQPPYATLVSDRRRLVTAARGDDKRAACDLLVGVPDRESVISGGQGVCEGDVPDKGLRCSGSFQLGCAEFSLAQFAILSLDLPAQRSAAQVIGGGRLPLAPRA